MSCYQKGVTCCCDSSEKINYDKINYDKINYDKINYDKINVQSIKVLFTLAWLKL